MMFRLIKTSRSSMEEIVYSWLTRAKKSGFPWTSIQVDSHTRAPRPCVRVHTYMSHASMHARTYIYSDRHKSTKLINMHMHYVGSGFHSKQRYGSGFFSMRLKLPPKDTAGVIPTFYIKPHFQWLMNINPCFELFFTFYLFVKGLF